MSAPPISYKAGAATECITPDESLWLAGFAVRKAPARGKISDLYVSALALEDAAGERFVMASIETIAITPTIADAVAKAVLTAHGLSRRQILLVATHTHYGPEFRPDKAPFFNIPAEYAAKLPQTTARLVAALTRVINQAIERLEPVRIFARCTNAGFAHNRRRHGVKDGTASTKDTVDHDVPILDCVDAAGRHKAIVFGYACHNTTIPPDDLRYCGDWAGFAKERLQQENDGAIAMFIPGAGADLDPEPDGSIELSRQHGDDLAIAVQRALRAPGIEISGPIRTELQEAELVLETVTTDTLNTMVDSTDQPRRVKALYLLDQLRRGEQLITTYRAPVQTVRLGNHLLMIALSGEPVVDWSHKFKQEFSQLQFDGTTPLTWVAGYCNDMFGYLPTRRLQAEGGYEGGRANLWSSIPAPFAGDVEERISEAVRRLVARISD